MTVYGRILLAGLGSAALLIAAFGFQYLGGLAPCPLCIWQRWPHAAAVVVALAGVSLFWRRHRAVAVLGGLVMLSSAGLGLYHAGIEQGWWPGPAGCAVPDPSGVSAEELLSRIMETPMVRCDEIAWDFLGLSMAAWNALASLALAALWLSAARPAPSPAHASSSASQ
jgi:disulfide bond formation protein DsbB